MMNMWVNNNPLNNCCSRVDIKRFHDTPRLYFSGESREVVNAICLSCNSHWFGLGSGVDLFTCKEWDDFISCESEIFNFRLNESKFKHPKLLFKKYFVDGRNIIDS